MAADSTIVALDIGTSKICAIIAELTESGEPEFLGMGVTPSSGLRRGVVINIEATLRSVAEAIEEAEQNAGREVQSVITGVAGGHIEGMNSRGVVAVTGRGREITQADIDRVIDAARAVVIPMDREILHVIPQEFIVDDQAGIRNPLDMIGVRLESEVHIITGSVTSAQNLVKCINRAGFRVNQMVLDGLAAAGTVLSTDERELGVLLLDLGGGTTDMLVYSDGAPYYTGVVGIGGAQVTNDISIMLKTPVESAERIKCEAGCCYVDMVEENEPVIIPGVGGRPPLSIQRRGLAEIIQPRMEEIFGMVREKLEKKGYLRSIGGGVVLTGGGALLPGAVDLAQDIFGTPARIGRPMDRQGLPAVYQKAELATAVGLVQYAAAHMDPIRSDVGRREGGRTLHTLGKWIRNFFE
ncbi:MAG: cell division protein FtsA [Spirochaetaceae bacterium]